MCCVCVNKCQYANHLKTAQGREEIAMLNILFLNYFHQFLGTIKKIWFKLAKLLLLGRKLKRFLEVLLAT